MSVHSWVEAARQDKYRQTPEHQQAISTIQSLLEGTTDADHAANTIASLYNPLLRSHPKVSPVVTLWVMVCEAVRLLGGDHQLAGRLIDLLNSISQLPDVLDEHGNTVSAPWKSAGYYWKDLPELATTFRESGIEIDPEAALDDQEEWNSQAVPLMNATSFGARYLVEGRQPIGMSWHAEISLMQGIEVPCQTSEQQRRAALYVPPAATWMTLGGGKIHDLCKIDQDRKDGAAGSTWEGDEWLWGKGRGYSMERWAFWKLRFNELASAPGLMDNIKDPAKKAAERMSQIEKNE